MSCAKKAIKNNNTSFAIVLDEPDLEEKLQNLNLDGGAAAKKKPAKKKPSKTPAKKKPSKKPSKKLTKKKPSKKKTAADSSMM